MPRGLVQRAGMGNHQVHGPDYPDPIQAFVTQASYTGPMTDRCPATPVLALLNREQAILEFNRRVLAQAQREDVPLLERLRYICIVSSNLDEFFEVRFADMLDAARDPQRRERAGRGARGPRPPTR
jgi:hypothetical protein